MATPLLRRLFSSVRRYQYVPLTASWDPRELTAARPAPISDADMARLERLSNLRLPREEGERARADVAAVLSTAAQLAGLSCDSEPLLSTRLRALPEAALEAAAAARWARLRADEVTEGGDAAGVVAHAAVREGFFFSAPRFVDGGEGAPAPGAAGGAANGGGSNGGGTCTECDKEEPLDSCSACGAAFCDDHDTDNLIYPINHKEGCSGHSPEDCDCLDTRGELPPLCHACADEAGV